MKALTAERLRELLDYDPETGVFTWRVSRGGTAVAGSVAGCVRSNDGYRKIAVDGEQVYAHRLAWFYMTGEWPAHQIDHKDCVRGNNRFSNLREATDSQNNRNTRISITNTSGFKGASFDRAKGRWMAQIKYAGRHRHLGYFDTAAEAHTAYCNAAMKVDPHFARFA